MNHLRRTVEYALRSVAAPPNRKVTAATILTLAVGIAACTAIMTVVEALFIRRLPYQSADRLVSVRMTTADRRGQDLYGQVADWNVFQHWATARPPAFEELAAYQTMPAILTGVSAATSISAVAITSNMIPFLGARPEFGRAFVPHEDVAGTAPVVLLSYAFWSSHFGRDVGVLGRSLALRGRNYEIIGVMARTFRVPLSIPEGNKSAGEVWIPMGAYRDAMRAASAPPVDVLGYLRLGVTRDAAEAQLDLIASRRSEVQDPTLVSQVTPLRRVIVGQVRTPVLILLGAAVFVLLIASANAANLQLERTIARARDFAVRMALGASSLRLVTQQVAESAILALCAGVVGVLLAFWTVPLLLRLADAQMPDVGPIGVNQTVLAAALAAALLAGFLSGLGPALRSARLASPDGLRAGFLGVRGRSTSSWSGSFLGISQVALGLMLLAGAGLVGRSLGSLTNANRGYAVDGVIVGALTLPRPRYPSAVERLAWARAVLERVRAVRGVSAAAIATGAPVVGGGRGDVTALSLSDAVDSRPRSMAVWAATPELFRVLGIPLLRGQTFPADDAQDAIVLDEAAAQELFPGEPPLGKRVSWDPETNPGTVVGVVGNIQEFSIDTRRNEFVRETLPHVYVPLAQDTRPFLRILVRTTGEPDGVISPLRDAIAGSDANVPLTLLETLRNVIAENAQRERLLAALIAMFAAIAVLMAAVGVYAIVAYSTARRTREIGLRMALGARPLDVIVLTLRRALQVTITGAAVGLLCALGAGQLLRSSLVEVSPMDPAVLLGATILLTGVGVLASYLPARRASQLEPMNALREPQ